MPAATTGRSHPHGIELVSDLPEGLPCLSGSFDGGSDALGMTIGILSHRSVPYSRLRPRPTQDHPSPLSGL
jgi:hypothetical protein